MILGVLSDTHSDRMNAIPHIIAEFKKRGAEVIIHCGDIEPQHVKPELFGNLPMVCVLTDDQVNKNRRKFAEPPPGWRYTRPKTKNRIVDFDGFSIYAGHKRSFEILFGSEDKLFKTLQTIRCDYDRVRFHT